MISTETASALREMLMELLVQDYRAGFEDSVLHRSRDLIAEYEGSQAARDFWQGALLPGGDEFLLETLGPGTYAVYLQVKAIESKEGAFVMPSWGTYGT